MAYNKFNKMMKELYTINMLHPKFNLIEHLNDVFEGEVSSIDKVYQALKEYREKLELDSNVYANDEEIATLFEDGLHIHSSIALEQLYKEYGNQEE